MKTKTVLCAFALLIQTAGWAAPAEEGQTGFVGATKLRPPLGVSTQYDGEPVVGQPLVLSLTITAGETAEASELSLTAREELVLVEPLAVVELGTLVPGEPVEIEVTVLPMAGGTSYLSVSLSADLRGRRQSTTFSIPIRLPEDNLRESADAEAGKTESTVRSLRAVEEIR